MYTYVYFSIFTLSITYILLSKLQHESSSFYKELLKEVKEKQSLPEAKTYKSIFYVHNVQ